MYLDIDVYICIYTYDLCVLYFNFFEEDIASFLIAYHIKAFNGQGMCVGSLEFIRNGDDYQPFIFKKFI